MKLVSGFLSLAICLWILYQVGTLGDLESQATGERGEKSPSLNIVCFSENLRHAAI